MPTYEYKCKKCKKAFSLELSFEQYDKQKRVKCPNPKCGSTATERVFASGFFAKTSKKS